MKLDSNHGSGIFFSISQALLSLFQKYCINPLIIIPKPANGKRNTFPIFLITFFYCFSAHSQLIVTGNDTINPGVPVTLSAEFGLPAFEVPMGDNSVVKGLNIGFPFTFYGEVYTRFSIGANGWISFGDLSVVDYWGATRNIRLPSAAPTSPKTCILGAMEDYDPAREGGPYIFYQSLGTSPNRKLVVMWCQCPMYGCADALATFQIVLKEGDTIEINLASKPVCENWDNRCTIGLQDETGTLCDTLPGMNRNSSSWSVRRESWRFIPASNLNYTVEKIPYGLEPIIPGNKITFRWFEGPELISEERTHVVTPMETTTYRILCNLCSGEELAREVTVTVIPYIPNAFSPNGDGLNDTFRILGLPPENIRFFLFQVFDRWGAVIFQSSDILEGWDGTLNGTECPAGQYVWGIYYEDNNRKRITNKGTILLVR